MKRTITVMTNDPRRNKIDILITGMVDRIVTITPNRVLLKGPSGQPVTAEVLIVPESKFAFKIVSISAQTGKNIDFSYREIKTDKGSEGYSLTVRNKRSIKGRYADKIILKTTSTYQPEIKLNVTGNIE